METSTPQQNDELSFEESLRELEEVVSVLEAGQVPLERSLELLKRGQALADRCDNTLGAAELALQQLVLTPDGELVAENVEGAEDN